MGGFDIPEVPVPDPLQIRHNPPPHATHLRRSERPSVPFYTPEQMYALRVDPSCQGVMDWITAAHAFAVDSLLGDHNYRVSRARHRHCLDTDAQGRDIHCAFCVTQQAPFSLPLGGFLTEHYAERGLYRQASFTRRDRIASQMSKYLPTLTDVVDVFGTFAWRVIAVAHALVLTSDTGFHRFTTASRLVPELRVGNGDDGRHVCARLARAIINARRQRRGYPPAPTGQAHRFRAELQIAAALHVVWRGDDPRRGTHTLDEAERQIAEVIGLVCGPQCIPAGDTAIPAPTGLPGADTSMLMSASDIALVGT